MLAPILAAATALTPAYLAYDPGPRDIEMRTNGVRASGEVVFAVTVDPSGSVADCRIVETSGSARLDALTCQNAVRNLRFAAARDAEGRPAYGVVREHMSWRDGYVFQRPRAPDVDVVLSVGRMPADWAAAPGVRIVYTVSPDGGVASCGPAAGAAVRVERNGMKAAESGREPPKDERIARAACKALPGAFKVEAAQDRGGKPVASVQSATVVFEEGKPGSAG